MVCVKSNEPSPPTVFLTRTISPRLVLVKVQVTVSPALNTTAPIGLPSEQVAEVCVQPDTASSETAYVPAVTTEFRLLKSVPSASSSRLNEAGLPFAKLLVNTKSCASFGTASLTIMIFPVWRVFTNVQVTFSPAARLMVAVRVPKLIVELVVGSTQLRFPVRLQPATAASVIV